MKLPTDHKSGLDRKDLKNPADRINMRLIAIVIFLISFGLYLNTLVNGFVFDDLHNVVANRWIKNIAYTPEVFTTHLAGFDKGFATNYYRPLVHVIYSVTYQILGTTPFGFHLVNLLFHSGVCVLVFLLTRAILSRSGVSIPAYSFMPPFIAALIFAAHPIHTEAVAWVAGVMDLSFTFFYLLSFYLYLRASDKDRPLRGAYLLSVVSFFFATLCKEPALTMPLVLLTYDYTFRRSELKLKEWVKIHLPYWIVAGIYLIIRMNALSGFAPVNTGIGLTPYECFLGILVLFSQYLEKLLFPVNLNVYRLFHPIASALTAKGMISLLIAVTFLILVLTVRKKNKVLFFGLLMIIIPLLPGLYIPALAQGMEKSLLAERYLYLPSFGFVLILATLAERALRNPGKGMVILTVVASVLMAWYSAGTIMRNGVWRDNHSLWLDAVKKSPDSAVAHGNIGYALYIEDRLDEAIEEYRVALDLKPDLLDTRLNLGVALHRKGLLDQAIEQYRVVLDRKPSAQACSNMGLALLDKGLIEEGMYWCRKALILNPDLADAHHILGIGYARSGLMDQAVQEFRIAVNLNPDNPNFKDNLIKALHTRKPLGASSDK